MGMRRPPRAGGAGGGSELLSERDLDRIVFGCGNFGGIGSAPGLRGAGDSEEQALRLLDHARRLGLRRFDTANTYGGGASEEMLGQWLRSQGASFLREVQIATKVGNPHGCPPGETPLSRTQIARHLDESLRRLGYAARFVTGYLYSPKADRPNCEGEYRGASATHAWCDVFLPGLGWIELDPTNGLVESPDLISIGAYRAGTSPRIDEALAKMDPVRAFLRQALDERVSLAESVAALGAVAGGA